MDTAADRIEGIEFVRSKGEVYRINYLGRRLADLDREVYPTVKTYIETDVVRRGFSLQYINVFSMGRISARVEVSDVKVTAVQHGHGSAVRR